MATLPKETRQWIVQNKPFASAILQGDNATFKLVAKELPQLSDGQVLVKALYFSNDPAQRCWISPMADPARLYMPPVEAGAPMGSDGIGEVIDSHAPNLPKGTVVRAMVNWTEYAVLDQNDCTPIRTLPGLNVTHFMGSLGLPGLTAYYALHEIVKATKDDSVVISGAAGATGSMAVQIAKKMIGCKYVVGIAGSDEKCRWVERMGADLCINYRSPSFEQDLIRATDGFVDVYFDNVGGEILDLMLKRMKRHGRIAACGTIANYNKDSAPTALKNFYEVVSNRISILGFIVFDYLHKQQEVTDLLVRAWKDGKLIIDDTTETIIESTFENVPRTWLRLYSGVNTGKMMTKLV